MHGDSLKDVAFLGPEGTFTHMAARKYFAGSRTVRFVEAPSIPAVFDTVSSGAADAGIVPVENSIEGGVTFTLDKLLETGIRLTGEVLVDIEQCLLTSAPSLEGVDKVLSHPQGLAQCRKWLHEQLPNASLVTTASTAGAALQAKGDPKAAAIASALAGELAGLRVALRGIQDLANNATRFVVLGGEEPAATGNDKTSLAFSTPHERGALCRALRIFDEESINLCRIESRPSGTARWQYVFYVDLEGHLADAPVSRAIERLASCSERVRVLGCYPAAN